MLGIDEKLLIGKHYTLVDSPSKLQWLIDKISSVEYLAFDTETTGLKWVTDKVIGISFSWAVNEAAYIPMYRNPTGDKFWVDDIFKLVVSKLKEVFENSGIKKIAHNAKFDTEMIWSNFGIKVKSQDNPSQNVYFDTMLAHYLLDENSRHKLELVATEYLDPKAARFEEQLMEILPKRKKENIWQLPIDSVMPYACADADHTYGLFLKFKALLTEQNLDVLYYDIILPLQHVLMILELNGITIDTEYMKDLGDKLDKVVGGIEVDIFGLAGKKFNVGSTQQLSGVLFDDLKLSTAGIKKNKKAYSTDKENLGLLKGKHSVIEYIGKWRRYTKLKSTYVDGILKRCVGDKLYASFHISSEDGSRGTVAGRLCVSGDTELNTSRGSFKISDLPVKCNIITHKGKLKPIVAKYYKGRERMFGVVLANGSKIKCTANHRFSTPDGWKRLSELIVGSMIVSYLGEKAERCNLDNFKESAIVEIKDIGIEGVWDIEVEDDHSYLAQGFINHNSSSDPNLQNIVRGPLIKRAFVASDGYTFISADFDQIELRVIAHYSQDPEMMRIYQEGGDIHSETTKEVWNLVDPWQEIKKKYLELRTKGKTVNFGLAYGQSDYTLAEQLVITQDEAKVISDRFFGKYQSIKPWIAGLQELLMRDKEIINIFGRRRRLPDLAIEKLPVRKYGAVPSCFKQGPKIKKDLGLDPFGDEWVKMDVLKARVGEDSGKKFQKCLMCSRLYDCVYEWERIRRNSIISHALRQGVNSYVQGTAVDLTDLSLIRIFDRCDEEDVDMALVLQVHDELVFECNDNQLEQGIKIMTEEMCGVGEGLISLPLTIDLKTCKRWSGEGDEEIFASKQEIEEYKAEDE